MNQIRVLLATDLPFWRMSTGAEQRIAGVARYVSQKPFQLRSFYVGPMTEDDMREIRRQRFDVDQQSSDNPPTAVGKRLKWFADATLHQITNWVVGFRTRQPSGEGPQSLRLDDFRWPWAIERFRDCVRQYDPHAIIFEYVKMAYLLDALSADERRHIKCAVDTHDVLHRRAQQFAEHGFPHWLEISAQQEAESLSKFDLIMAIQRNEASLFRELAPGPTTAVVGHAVAPAIGPPEEHPDEENKSGPSRRLTVGYIGSKNFSNWQAINNFLDRAWPTVNRNHAHCVELVIAGQICHWFESRGETETNHTWLPENARLLGLVDSLEEFYGQVDVVINPVEFGTGLKIKNAESLSFGKLLITTTNGFDGMPEETRLACMIVDSVEEMGEAILALCGDLTPLHKMQQLAFELAQTEFSEEQAYSELRHWLLAEK